MTSPEESAEFEFEKIKKPNNNDLSGRINELEKFLFSKGFKIIRILKIQSAYPTSWQELKNE